MFWRLPAIVREQVHVCQHECCKCLGVFSCHSPGFCSVHQEVHLRFLIESHFSKVYKQKLRVIFFFININVTVIFCLAEIRISLLCSGAFLGCSNSKLRSSQFCWYHRGVEIGVSHPTKSSSIPLSHSETSRLPSHSCP